MLIVEYMRDSSHIRYGWSLY